MSRILYSALLYLLVPGIIARLLWRSLRSPAHAKRWSERFGFISSAAADQDIIWLHAVSVGEVVAAVPLVKALQKQYSNQRILMTCTTVTGSERIQAIFPDSVDHHYAPYDLPNSIGRFLERSHPRLLIIMETELWPNIIAECKCRGIPVFLVNGRLSARSAKGYLRIGSLVRPMMRQIHRIAAQSKEDANRFVQIGASANSLSIVGNVKFDLTISPELESKAASLAASWRGLSNRPIVLAASTHKGEDEIILEAFAKIKKYHNRTLLVLVPRHPERFDQVADLCKKSGFKISRRSQGTMPSTSDILIGDTMGELLTFFGACDVAFVGGSLVPIGGHNIIEPAAWGKPIISGPHLFNFSKASELLLSKGGMLICANAEDLASSCTKILDDDVFRKSMSLTAHCVAKDNRGALTNIMSLIDSSISK